MSAAAVLVEISDVEKAHLALLVDQFLELVSEESSDTTDEALLRLTPNAYPDDPEAGAEFRRLTRDDLLSRRAIEAAAMLATLRPDNEVIDPTDLAHPDSLEPREMQLSADDARSWMRTLAALRLVIASRLGITDDNDEPDEDPRYGVYEWLGYRLDSLVTSLSH